MNTFQRITVIACLALAGESSACSVPVFRYALERWPADLYRMTIFYREALSADQQAVVDALHNASEEGLVNLGVRVVNVAGQLTEATGKLWDPQTMTNLPWAVIQYPVATGLEQPVGQGVLDAKFAQEILDSPVRREVRQRILQGESVVWLLLESGNKLQDEKAAKLLQAEFTTLTDILEVTPPDPMDPRPDVNVALKIAFSLMRLSRDNPAEHFLVSQLLNIQPRLAEAKGPIVFPVFGRGRALCGLVEDELTAETVEAITRFLTGDCSCEVKAMNPGVDLLVAVDWDASLEGRVAQEPEMPPLVSLSQLAANAQPPEEVAETTVPPPQASPLMRNLIVAVGLGILAVVVGAVWLRRIGRK